MREIAPTLEALDCSRGLLHERAHNASQKRHVTHRPVSTAHACTPLRARTSTAVESEHPQFPLADDHERFQPVFLLAPLALYLPVVFPLEHSLFRPRCTQQGELFIGDRD